MNTEPWRLARTFDATNRVVTVTGADGAVKATASPDSGDRRATGQQVHDLFVSYSTRDKPVADAIVARLEQAGIRCWIAPRDILPGRVWGEAIVQAIETSRVMVVVLSGEANHSRQVLREVNHAVANDVMVVPFRIEAVEPTGAMAYYLSSEHWLDAMTPPLDAHIARLVDVAGVLLDHSAPATPTPTPTAAAPTPAAPTTRRRPTTKLVALTAVAALAVIGTVWALVSTRSSPGETAATASNANGSEEQPATTDDQPVPADEQPAAADDQPASAGDVPDGFLSYANDDPGFTVAYPDTWTGFPWTKEGRDVGKAVLDDWAWLKSNLVGTLSVSDFDEAQLQFVILDTTIQSLASDYPTWGIVYDSLIVAADPVSAKESIIQTWWDAENIEAEPFTSPAGEGARITWELPMEGGSTLNVVQYRVRDVEDDMWIIHFEGLPDADRDNMDAVAQSFRPEP